MKDENDLIGEEEFEDLTPDNIPELSNEKIIKLLGILTTTYGEDAKECERVVLTSRGTDEKNAALILQKLNAGQCVICAALAKVLNNQIAISEGQSI